MKTPEIYSEWCEIFDNIEKWEIGHQDRETLEAIDRGNIRWVSGVAERITNRLLNLINKRLDKLNSFFNNRIKVSQYAIDLEYLLVLYRKELIFIKHIENLRIFPEDLRQELTQNLITIAHNMQQSLEDNAKKDLSGTLKRIVLNNKIDNI